VSRSRFYPSDDVTVGEWRYLRSHYPEKEARIVRAWIGRLVARLVKKGMAAKAIHLGIMRCIADTEDAQARPAAKRRQADLLKAQKARATYLTSLRRLHRPEMFRDQDGEFQVREISDADLLKIGDRVIAEVAEPQTLPVGRPPAARTTGDTMLKAAGLSARDRRDLFAALGLVEQD
jgi:hypothetical protein